MKLARLFLFTWVLFIATMAGCKKKEEAPVTVGAPPPESAPVPSAPVPRPLELESIEEKPFAVVKVFYATDRKKSGKSIASDFFSSQRGVLSYGTCDVSIPRLHKMGQLEAPSVSRLEFRETPEKHVVLLSVDPIEKDEYFAQVAQKVTESPGNKLLVFVHGFNVSFEDAARRTAQMTYDLAFKGAPIFYSWPSKAKMSLQGYKNDEKTVQLTATNLKQFLLEIVEKTDAENIYLIAHSMGNRALVNAFSELIATRPELKPRFKEIILTAPDIDADVFKRDIVPKITGGPSQISLYVSANDKALQYSRQLHDALRAGEAGEQIVVVPGVETVDASSVDTSFIGHFYYAERRSVLSDVFYIVNEDKRPGQRFGLQEVRATTGKYWRFRE